MPPPFPPQTELLTPLLEQLDDAGGRAPTTEIFDRLAEHVNLDHRDRATRVPQRGGRSGTINAWNRHVRWVQQHAKLLGLTHAPEHAVWALTGPGKATLRNTHPGTIVTVWETNHGIALWADAHSAADVIDDASVDLIVTSPPYPLLRRKPYQNQRAERKHIDWLLEICERWKPKLSASGSLVLNVADTWIRSLPAQSAWIERLTIRLLDELGFFKAQTHYWQNPAKMPAPAEWVTIRRQRVTPQIEHCLWLVLDPHQAKACNRNVLRPYSSSMRRRIEAGGEPAQKRPSGHNRLEGAFSRDNGGAIPGNLITAPNTTSNSLAMRRAREHDIPLHPARFPAALPRYFIQLCTDPGDLVGDIFAGSGTTLQEADALQRRWFGCDLSLTYLQGAALAMHDAPGFRSHITHLATPRLPSTATRPQHDLFPSAA